MWMADFCQAFEANKSNSLLASIRPGSVFSVLEIDQDPEKQRNDDHPVSNSGPAVNGVSISYHHKSGPEVRIGSKIIRGFQVFDLGQPHGFLFAFTLFKVLVKGGHHD